MRWNRFSCVLMVLGVILFGMTPVLTAQAAKGKTIVRVFRIQYAEPAEVSAAIQPLLSNRGSITVQPAKRRITVSDVPERIRKVSRLVRDMDVRPEFFRISVVLLRGYSHPPKPGRDFKIPPHLGKMFPFKSYKKLGVAELQGQVKDTLSVDLDEGYRLKMTANKSRSEDFAFGLPADSHRLDLHPVILLRIKENGETRQVLKTRVILSENQEISIGAGAAEDAHEGLVLILKALPVENP